MAFLRLVSDNFAPDKFALTSGDLLKLQQLKFADCIWATVKFALLKLVPLRLAKFNLA